MSVKITYFVHGTTTDNERGISSGWSDADLSEKGIEQVRNLREQTNGQKFSAVFCSDLKRATDSANLAWGGIYPIFPDRRLRECNYGDYNGRPSEIVDSLQEEMIVDRFPHGESYEDVKVRVLDFLKFLKENYNGQSIAIVAHKAPQLALETLLNGKSWQQAFSEDWRKTKSWQPGWEYTYD